MRRLRLVKVNNFLKRDLKNFNVYGLYITLLFYAFQIGHESKPKG